MFLMATAASSVSTPDIWGWIKSLPPVSQWPDTCMSTCICPPSTSAQPPLQLFLTKSFQTQYPSVTCTIIADLNLPITLWTSKSFKIKTHTTKVIEEKTMYKMFCNFIKDVLCYGTNKSTSFRNIPPLKSLPDFKDIFNLSFFTLTLLICTYEAPQAIRLGCLHALKNHLTNLKSRDASKVLMRVLGSNIEEQWMRSLNLAVTNWIVEFKAIDNRITTPSPLFSYAISTGGLCKVQLYCPIIAMNLETSSTSSIPERLAFSLMYHQLEGVVQLRHKVVIRDKWIDVGLIVDNIRSVYGHFLQILHILLAYSIKNKESYTRCDVIKLVSETLMTERGAGAMEKHFPSRILLQLTPTVQNNVLAVSVSKSTDNPACELGSEKSIEGGFDVPDSLLGLKVSASETKTMSMKPWKFEQSVYGNTANLNWSLHDSVDGREVFSSKPSKFELMQSRAWFKDRYSSAYRPFNKQGGVVFTGDDYGKSVWWKVEKRATRTTMNWEIKGWIWLTYWPNNYTTQYSETRRLEFKEFLNLPLLPNIS